MAKRGFDGACLAHVQQSAIRLAAQTVQHRKASGKSSSIEEIKFFVEKNIAGKDYKVDSDAITPDHIATYLSNKILLQKLIPEQLINEAWSLVIAKFPEDIFGSEPQIVTTNWLAQHLVALKAYVLRLEKTTPAFARSIRASAGKITSSYIDRQGLRSAIDVLVEAAAESAANFDVDLEAEAHTDTNSNTSHPC